MRTASWLLLAAAALALLTPRKVEAGACISARFHDWQDGGCNQTFAGVGGAPSGRNNPGGNQSGCTGCSGMPRWWVSEPYETLFLADTPLSYTMSSGQEMAFTFYYRQRYQLPGQDEVPGFYTSPLYYRHDQGDNYAQQARVCGMTNAAWGHSWMKDILFWDSQWEWAGQQGGASGQPFQYGYEAFVYCPQGDIQYFSSSGSLQDLRSRTRLQPLSALGYLTATLSQVADANGTYWGDSQTNGFELVYPDGSKDVFGLCYYQMTRAPGPTFLYTGAHALLTQRIDPQGRLTSLGYEHKAFTNFWKCPRTSPYYGYRLKYVVDPDGRTNTFIYNTNAPTSSWANTFCDIEDTTNLVLSALPPHHLWQLTEIDDPYGRKTTLSYDNLSGILTNITDAAGLSSSFQYDAATTSTNVNLPDPAGRCGGGSCPTNITGLAIGSGWITNLTTPYGSTGFRFYQLTESGSINGFQQRAIYVSEPEGAHQFFVYEHTNGVIPSTATAPTDIAGQSFDDGNSGGIHHALTYRNTFHWGRRQFAALSSSARSSLATGNLAGAISSLALGDYNKADLKHWLVLGTDQLSITEALSSEQDPSPDSAGQFAGPRTWYNYPDKPSGSPEQLGDNTQISCIARLLPDGSSQYITFNFYSPGWPCAGLVSDNESSYSRPDGAVGVVTNWFAYAANGIDLASVSNSVGQFSRYGYNGVHQVTFITNSLNQVTGVSWDSETLNLSQVSLPSGETVTLNYFAPAYPPTWPLGNTNSLLSSLSLQPEGLTVQIADYGSGLPRVVTTSGTGLPSLTVTNFWDGLNRLTGTVFPDGTSVSNTYDRLYLGGAKDRLGHWTGYSYDGLEHVATITDALTNITTLGWCDCGSLSSITDPLTNITRLNYNNQGLLTGITNADTSSVTYALDSIGRVTQVADGLNKALTYGYNNQGLLTTVSNAYGLLSGVVYDAANRPIQLTDANGVTVTNQFDLLDRLTARFLPDGIGEGFGWSTNGIVAYTNRDQKVTRFTRDAAGRVTYATNANLEVTHLSYNALNELTDLWDGRTSHAGWNYNQYGLLISETNALGQAVVVYTRDSNGQITNRWTPQFGNTRYGRDALGNILTINYPQSTNRYSFDALNRLKTMVDDVGTTTFGYTVAGQLQSAGGLWANDTITYGYVQQLRQTLTLAQPSGGNWQQTYGYDAAWRLQNLSSPAGSFGYGFSAANPASPLFRTLTLPNYASITNHYDSLARLDYTALVNYWGHVLDGYSYGMDPLGLRTNIVRDLGLTRSTVSVGYDPTAQIISWTAKEANGTPRLNEQLGYAFDKAGNLLSRTNGGLIQTFNCDALNELTNITRNNVMTVSGNTPAPATSVTVNGRLAQTNGDFTFAATNISLLDGANVFTNVAVNAYTLRRTNILTVSLPASVMLHYDSNGNLTNDGSRSFAYDAENQLTNVTVTNAAAGTSSKTEFVYDGLGRRRITKEFAWQGGQWAKTNETRGVFDGYLLVQERDSNNIVLRTYTRGPDLRGGLHRAGGIGGLLAQTDGSGVSMFYHSDGAGNITALMDGTQNVAARYMQDPFGRMIGEWGPMGGPNTMGFSSMLRLDRAGIVGFPRRFYDPTLQRFLNRDPIGVRGGINLYRFVRNNPLRYVDPLGLQEGAEEMRPEAEMGPPDPIGARVQMELDLTGKVDPKDILPQEQREELERDFLTRRPALPETALSEAKPEPARPGTWLTKLVDKVSNALKGDCPAKRGPKPGLEGPHNQKIKELAEELKAEGNKILRGGKQPGLKEAVIRTPGGEKESRRPDILIETEGGEKRGVNVGKTKADGTPVPREQDALDDLNGPGNLPTDFFPYDR